MNPYDPNFKLYEGQPSPQQVQQPPAQPLPQAQPAQGGLHLLEAIGNFVLAGAHMIGGDDDEEENEAPRRRPRRRFGFGNPSGSTGKNCCSAKR